MILSYALIFVRFPRVISLPDFMSQGICPTTGKPPPPLAQAEASNFLVDALPSHDFPLPKDPRRERRFRVSFPSFAGLFFHLFVEELSSLLIFFKTFTNRHRGGSGVSPSFSFGSR